MVAKPELEFEESELFDHDDLADNTNTSPELTHASLQGAVCEFDSESDDGIQLDIDEDSSSDHGVDLPRDSILLSSAEQTTSILQDLSTSHTGSIVGSLKRFDSLGTKGQRPFRSESDLPLAASLPARAFNTTSTTRSGWDVSNVRDDRRTYGGFGEFDDSSKALGTSMPIRIPHLMKSRSAATGVGTVNDGVNGVGDEKQEAAGAAGKLNFTPPHLLEDETDYGELDAHTLSMHGSPSAAEKREKLRARNAILRSTGFIEGQMIRNSMAEVVDIVKESLISQSSAKIPTPGPRMRQTSSLSALLGTSN